MRAARYYIYTGTKTHWHLHLLHAHTKKARGKWLWDSLDDSGTYVGRLERVRGTWETGSVLPVGEPLYRSGCDIVMYDAAAPGGAWRWLLSAGPFPLPPLLLLLLLLLLPFPFATLPRLPLPLPLAGQLLRVGESSSPRGLSNS